MRALIKQMIYLDNSATTKPAAEAVAAMTRVLTEDFGNPSSLYRIGLDAEKIVKAAREEVAKALECKPAELTFTSCGTESNNTVLKGVWRSRNRQGKRIITTSVEHPAVLRVCEELEQMGADVVYLPVTPDGSFDMDAFDAALNKDTILVSVMYVNNESGAVMPIKEIAAKAHGLGNGCLVHTDAVQAFGKLDCSVKDLGVDFLSLSGHKIHGPKGVGALYVKNVLHIPAFMLGGGQESGFRSGTENMPGIAGLGAAAKLLNENWKRNAAKMAETRAYLKERILAEIPDVKVNSPAEGAPSVLNVSFLNCRAEVLLHQLENDQIYVSTGSACSSKKKGSHVLTAMHLRPEEIEGAIRFSFCADNTKEQMDVVVEKLKFYTDSQRRLRKAFKK